MQLEHKPDFDKVLARFEAWWACELVDRPLVTMSVKPPKPGPALPVKKHATERERWFDVEYALDRLEASLPHRVFFAESYPAYMPNLGPEICSTLFGAELEFGPATTWSVPAARSCAEIVKMKPDFENPYWKAIRRATDLSLARGRGRWITGITDLHTNGDLPASLRDPQQFAVDLAEDLDAATAAVEHVTQFFPAIYDDLWARVRAAGQPSSTWAPALHAGRSYVTSCDFICMISPAMFQRAILPSIVREMRFLERNYFHLDGPGALRHLDALLALPELNGLQWIYGAGNGPARKWMEVYKRAQAAGKCLQIACEDLADAEAFVGELKPEGVWFTIGGAYSIDQAKSFVRKSERWAARG
jgi:hypothetical protein